MIKFSTKQLVDMLVLQETLNIRVHPEWRTQDYAWHRAAWMEAAELMDHIGWKWWKNQPADLFQAQIEVVDIWHFALSYALQDVGADINLVASKIRDDEALAAQPLENAWNASVSMSGEYGALRNLIERFVETCVSDGAVSPAFVLHLADKLGLTADEMHRQYVGKNVLNLFRQDHGYKEGTYRKMWRDLEDNKVVEAWQKAEPEWTPQQLMEELERSYATA